jgi:hypothetical protein
MVRRACFSFYQIQAVFTTISYTNYSATALYFCYCVFPLKALREIFRLFLDSMHIILLVLLHRLGFIRAMKYVDPYRTCRSHLTLFSFESLKERDMSSARQPAVVNSNRFGPSAIGIIHHAKLRIRNSNSKQYVGSNLAPDSYEFALCCSGIGRHIEYYEN